MPTDRPSFQATRMRYAKHRTRLFASVEDAARSSIPDIGISELDDAAIMRFRAWDTGQRAERCREWDWAYWAERKTDPKVLAAAIWLPPEPGAEPDLQALLWADINPGGTCVRLHNLESFPFSPAHPLKRRLVPLAVQLVEGYAQRLNIPACRLVKAHALLLRWYEKLGYRVVATHAVVGGKECLYDLEKMLSGDRP